MGHFGVKVVSDNRRKPANTVCVDKSMWVGNIYFKHKYVHKYTGQVRTQCKKFDKLFIGTKEYAEMGE